jgi:DNA polymerase elongation subunit (family B)
MQALPKLGRYEEKTKYKKREAYNNDPLPVPLTDPRFPGLRFEPARPGAKKKDPDYKDRIVSDDTKFNIFDVPDTTFIKEAEIELHEVQPFAEYTEGVAMIDCEWIGPDGGQATGTINDVLVAIGLRNRGKSYLGCNADKTEKELLEWFFRSLDNLKDVHTITGYAIYGFFRGTEEVMVDLAMIYHRAHHHGIGEFCPWRPAEGKFTTYRWQNAIVFGKPLEVPAWDCDKYELIDLYAQIVLYDSLVRKLDNYRLKDSVIGFGLRQDKRIEIGDQIYDFWARGEIDTIKNYLDYDLEDVELLWNFLIPQKYFMKSYMPMTLQRITTTGTGSWWNLFLCQRTGKRPQKTETCHYQGALTYYHANVSRGLAKMDYSGLYPSIMLTWLIASSKDTEYFSLKTLQFLLKYRKSIKKSPAWIRFDGGDRSPECLDSDGRQHTAKILANSLYGLWNTRGLSYNDPFSGAAITAYGRGLTRHMINWLHQNDFETRGCFAADTEVLTSEGNRPIESLVGKTTHVLNKDKEWVPVEFKSYGVQRIVKLHLRNNKRDVYIQTTSNHKWLTTSGEFKITTDLKKKGNPNVYRGIDSIPVNLPDKPDDTSNEYKLGVVHGIVYGDGVLQKKSLLTINSRSQHKYAHQIQLVGEKRNLYSQLVEACKSDLITLHDIRTYDQWPDSYFVTLRSDILMKDLPENHNPSYILGFVRGLLSTDGHVSGKDGCPEIIGSKKVAEFVNEYSYLAGFYPTGISIAAKAGVNAPINGKPVIQKDDCYKVRFSKNSLCEADFLRDFHKNKWLKHPSVKNLGKWYIQSIDVTDDYEEVYCCTETNTHTFTLAHGILTGNSDTDAAVAQITNPEKYGIHLFEKGMSNYTTEEIIDNLQKMDNLFRETGDRLNATMPGVTAVEYEDLIPFMWVPPNLKDKSAGQTLVDKLNSIDCYEEVAPDHVDAGLSKNYIYFVAKRDGEGNLTGKFGQKCKGKFKKRGFSYIQQGFVIDCISKLFYEGEEAATKFAQETRGAIASGSFPIDKLQKTVLVAANWKAFPEWGFPVGSKPTIHYVWRGEVTGKRVIKKVFVPSDDITETYAPEYYLAQFDEVMKELPISLPKEQLELLG